jgi:large subunit ribosomal protein L10
MSKQLKNFVTEDLKKRFQALDSYILVDYRGLNSAQSFELRRLLHEAGTRMTVVPNRLAVRILDRWKGKKGEFRDLFRGPTAILYARDGAVSASKAVMGWKKKNKDLLPIKGGVLGEEILGPKEAEGLSKIPDRPQLLAQVAGCFQGPLSRLAAAMQGIIARVAYALDGRRKKLEEGGGGGSAVAANGTEGKNPEAGGPAA